MTYPYLGFGLGLRPDHYTDILNSKPAVDWFEIISENYMVPGGRPLHYLDAIRQHYPMVMHGVSLSIGAVKPLNVEYLTQLKQLIARVEPEWISDHLCWTGFNTTNLHDLLPLPYTEEALEHVAARVGQVQDFLGRSILLENVSSYVTYCDSTLTEWDFINTLAARTGCSILLDINNIYVSSFNHAFDPYTFIDAIDPKHVVQFHLAGHTNKGTHIIDTHDHPIVTDVWTLYRYACRRFGRVSTMIERDDNIPALEVLLDELNEARSIAKQEVCDGVPA